MPVQSECYHKVKAVCDRLAMLAAQCCEAQFEKRFRFLDTVCKLWSGSYDQSKAVLSHDTCHPNNADVSAVNLLEQSEVDTVTHSEDSISSTVEVNLLTDDCSKQRNSVQRQLENCFSAVISNLENLLRSPDVLNSDKHNCSVCCERFVPGSSRPAGHTLVTGARRIEEKCRYVCCFCCRRFTTSTALLRHLGHHGYYTVAERTYESNKVVTSRHCGNTNRTNVKQFEPLSCKSCSKRFRTLAKLESHMQLAHKDSQRCCKSARELDKHVPRRRVSEDDVHSQCSQQPSHTVLQQSNGATAAAVELNAGSIRCQDCGAGNFKSWRALTLHRRTQHSGRRLVHTCSRCPRQFLYASDLRKHKHRHTGRQRPHVCSVCDKGFYHAADLSVHERIHCGADAMPPPPLSCSVCQRWMSSMTGLRAHMRIHRPDAPPTVCTICDKSFSYLSSLRAHMKRQHAATKTSDHWTCVHCSAHFSSQPLLTDHTTSCLASKCREDSQAVVSTQISSHNNVLQATRTMEPFNENHLETLSFQHRSESLDCNNKVKQDDKSDTDHVLGNGINPYAHRNSTADTADGDERRLMQLRHWQRKYPGRKIVPHVCTTCGQQFLQAVQLRKHMIKHTKTDDNGVEFPYTCHTCRRHFLFANDLRRHLVTHSNDRPHCCLVCSRPFKREDDLSKHMKTHGDVRPYQCTQCSERLESTSKLRKHMRKVHGDRFECIHCHAFFVRRSLLKKHKRQHHTGDMASTSSTAAAAGAGVGVGGFMCDRCGKSFHYESDLRAHLYTSHSRRHSPVHVCAWCSRQFASTSHLASHERTHTGDKPFTCDSCGKQFTQSGSLNVHRRTHTNPQPYPCHVCGQRFASRQYARKHFTMRHANHDNTATAGHTDTGQQH